MNIVLAVRLAEPGGDHVVVLGVVAVHGTQGAGHEVLGRVTVGAPEEDDPVPGRGLAVQDVKDVGRGELLRVPAVAVAHDRVAAPALSVPAMPRPPPASASVAAPAAIFALKDIRVPPNGTSTVLRARIKGDRSPSRRQLFARSVLRCVLAPARECSRPDGSAEDRPG